MPDEPAPALGPERMNDLENARDDSNPAKEEDADQGRQGHVSKNDNAGNNEYDAKQNTKPRWQLAAAAGRNRRHNHRGYPLLAV